MQAIYDEEGIVGVIESAGTMNWNSGMAADPRSVKVAADNGIDIRGHRARQICAEDFERFDIIFVMDRENERAVRAIAPPAAAAKIRRIRNTPDHSADADVADPYSGNEKHFLAVYALLQERCREVSQEIARAKQK